MHILYFSKNGSAFAYNRFEIRTSTCSLTNYVISFEGLGPVIQFAFIYRMKELINIMHSKLKGGLFFILLPIWAQLFKASLA